MNSALLKQITALPSMTSTELRALWKELGMGDSLHFNKPYLIKRIAYRLQELALGGESIAYIRRMEALVRGKAKVKAAPRPITGTRLIREYQGEEHQVTVLEDGFEYRKQKYKSLSVIARHITGTRWSGPAFFGLKRVS
jgi:hypothetical protein